MLIKIAMPIFKCQEDKHIFFSRLKELANFSQLDTNEFTCHLTLTGSKAETPTTELEEICNIWGVKYTLSGE